MNECVVQTLAVAVAAFLPTSELFVAVPAGYALGLDAASVYAATVLGNFLPVLLLSVLYDRLSRVRRLERLFARLDSPKARHRVNRYGLWFVLAATPLVGAWAMTVSARLLGMGTRRVCAAAFSSLCAYALVVVMVVFCGGGALFG